MKEYKTKRSKALTKQEKKLKNLAKRKGDPNLCKSSADHGKNSVHRADKIQFNIEDSGDADTQKNDKQTCFDRVGNLM